MLRTCALLALGCLIAGCKPSPAGFVLIFPDEAAKAEAQDANVQILDPGSVDSCPFYLGSPPPKPDEALERGGGAVDLTDGEIVAGTGKLVKIPTGFQTLLISVLNSNRTIVLRACRRGEIKGGETYELELQRVGGAPDMAAPPDLAAPADLQPDLITPPDLTPLKTLSVTVTELRAPARKIANASVTVTDSADVASASVITDATGVARIATAGLTPPLRVVATAAGENGFSGFASVSGLMPTFTNDQSAFTLPVELDPPATSAGNTIKITVADESGAYETYWLGTNEIAADLKDGAGSAATETTIPDLITSGQYRVAVVDRSPSVRVWTPGQPVAVGTTFNPATGEFRAVSHSLAITLVKSGNVAFTDHAFAAILMLPSQTTQAAIPLIPSTPYVASGSQSGQVVASASAVQASAVLLTEMSATGTNVYSVSRRQLAAATPATDAFTSAVLDPPTVGDLSAVTTASTAFNISVTPPNTLTLSSAYLYVRIKDSGDKIHSHLFAPATNPTVVNVPAVLPAGTYTIEAEFVKNFTLPGGSVAATLGDDWAKLVRPIPEQVARRTVSLTLN